MLVPGPLPPRGRFVLRSDTHRLDGHLEVRQDGRLLHQARARLLAGRSIELSGGWISGVDPAGGPVHVRVR